MDGAESRTSQFEHGRGSGRSQVEVAMIEGVFCTSVGQFTILVLNEHVRFRNRKRAFRIHGANDLDSGDVKFMTSVRTFVNTYCSVEDDAGFDDHALE